MRNYDAEERVGAVFADPDRHVVSLRQEVEERGQVSGVVLPVPVRKGDERGPRVAHPYLERPAVAGRQGVPNHPERDFALEVREDPVGTVGARVIDDEEFEIGARGTQVPPFPDHLSDDGRLVAAGDDQCNALD